VVALYRVLLRQDGALNDSIATREGNGSGNDDDDDARRGAICVYSRAALRA